jgi:elongation factor Ts
MAAVSIEQIKTLRNQTQAPMQDCRKALEESQGDIPQALELLRQRGRIIAEKRAGKTTGQGRVESYTHLGKIGVLVEVQCETDFVANTDHFQTFCKDLAMQVAAACPATVDALLAQPFIKNESVTIQQQLEDVITKTGERVVIGRFARFQLGEHTT